MATLEDVVGGEVVVEAVEVLMVQEFGGVGLGDELYGILVKVRGSDAYLRSIRSRD